MSDLCPLCLSKGRKSVQKYFQMNLTEVARMCADAKCTYPFSLAYTDTLIRQDFMDMDKDGGIKMDMESLQEREPGVPFHSLHEMNVTKTEPVKDANFPSTTEENENISDLMDLFDTDNFFNENIKDVDNFIPELESLFRSLEEETVVVNSENVLPVGSDLKKLNNGLSTDSDLKKLNNGLSTDSDLKKLNNGLSIDSFAPRAEGKTANNIISEFQLKELFADIEENKDHYLVMTESCQSGSTNISTKWSETSSYLEDTVDRYVTVPNTNQSQELALTLVCGESEHSGSTAAGPPLLNRSTSSATKTTQDLNISQHVVDSETVATNDSEVHAGPGTVNGGIPLQPLTKWKVRPNETFNLKTANPALQEKSFGQLSHTEISRSMTNCNKTATENRTDIMTSEDGTHGVSLYIAREVQDHSYFKLKDEHSISTSQVESFELPSHDETSHSFSTVNNSVTGESMSDMAEEVCTPGLTASTMREVLEHSYFKVRDENETGQLNVGTDCPVITERSFPVTIDIHDMDQPFSETDIGDLTVDVLNMALSDIPVAQNVTVVSCDMESIASGIEMKEAAFKGLNLETGQSSTTENIFAAMNNTASTSQLHLITNEGIEETVTTSNQAVTLGVPIKVGRLNAEENAYTVTNCIPDIPANIKSSNLHVTHWRNTAVSDVDVLQKLTQTTKGRHIAITRKISTGMGSPQFPAVGLDMEQVENGNSADVQKNKLCSRRRAKKKIKNDLKIDGLQYSSLTNEKNQADLTNSERLSGPEITSALVADSEKHIAPHIGNIGENSNMYVIKCRENVPFPDFSKLGKNVVSVTYMKPQVSPTDPSHQQSLNISKPLSLESLAAATQKRAKGDMTASQVEQNKSTEIPALPPGSFSQQNAAKLCTTQQNKLIIKETDTDKISSRLKSHISFARIKREKFAGFTFEKPFMPQENLGTYSKKNNTSKTGRVSKGIKKHQRHNKALPSLTNPPHPDPSTPSTSSPNSSNKVSMLETQCNIEGNQVENTNGLHYTCVKKESDHEIPQWIQELLM